MKDHLKRPLEEMTASEKEFFERTCSMEAERLISRFKDSPNVLRGIAVKLRQAGEKALGMDRRPEIAEPSNPSWGSE